MKFVPLALSLSIAVALGSYTPAVLAQDQLVTSICEYVAKDDKSRLRNKLKENRLKLRNIYSGISCNGTNLLRYAMINNANATGEFIAKKLPASELAAGGDVEWAKANGHGSSAIVAAINERAGS